MIYSMMTQKTWAEKAHAKTLALARQKLNKSRAGKFIIASINDGGSPEMVALTLEDWSHGGDPTADHSHKSDQASDGPSLAEQKALQQFAAALQEAQRIAVQLEGDQTRKCKTPMTYQGDSRTTLYHCEKTQKP